MNRVLAGLPQPLKVNATKAAAKIVGLIVGVPKSLDTHFCVTHP